MPQIDFSRLLSELDNWAEGPEPATFWWRDDDATVPCGELDRLLDIAAGRPLALATVPFHATAGLAQRLASEPLVTVFQHGWKHASHVPAGVKSEYPPQRSLRTVAKELRDGAAKLLDLFGPRFVQVFAPPWHQFDQAYFPLLRDTGFKGFSFKGRRADVPLHGMPQNNAHCAPIRWSDPPGFGRPDEYIAQIVDHLEYRRNGGDRAEATGILTHHRLQTDDSLIFVESLLDLVETHPNARLSNPAKLFGVS